MTRLALALMADLLLAAGCSSDGADDTETGGDRGATTVPDDPDAIRVAIVSDSEIAPDVADRLDGRSDVTVVFRELHVGATMAELDAFIGGAEDAQADVLVYAGGTNDLSSGPMVMLDGLTTRLTDLADRFPCVVFAAPIFKYAPAPREQLEVQNAGTRTLERAAADTGAVVVSYFDISLDMLVAGEEFFGPGELGDLHPGDAAHPAIADAFATAVASCPA